MKKIINILNITLLTSLLGLAQAGTTISLFNFNNASFDQDNVNINNLSKQISSDFINLMKNDMAFIDEVNFISTEELEKELLLVRKSLLNEVKQELNSGILDIIPRSNFSQIVDQVSKGNLNKIQLDTLTDSLLFLVSNSTRDIAKNMLLSNSSNTGQWGEITISDLYNFIEKISHESIWKSTFSSLIASSKNDFNTDVTITSTYKIEDDNITVNFFLYNLDNLQILGRVSAKNSIHNLNVLIKDLAFKLLYELGVLINDQQKAQLCMYDVKQFSKKKQSLYLTSLFISEDIKQLKYRMQFSDTYNLMNQYYISLISGLMENRINYDIKFYNDDHFYNIYATESVNDSTFFVNVLNDDWSNKVELSQNLHVNQKRQQSKMMVEIDYRYIQAIQFKSDQESFIDMLKQISIYTFIVTSGFLLVQFF